jgi:Na+/H+ antiporter 1
VATRHPPVEGSWSAGPSPVARRLAVPLREFPDTEAAGGLVLLAAAGVALVWANSPWSPAYEALWGTELAVEVGRWTLALDLRHWVNDGLMALFFLVVGLEIKRELVAGELRTWPRAALPVVAAVGGMVLPALLFLALDSDEESRDGWTAAVSAASVGLRTLVVEPEVFGGQAGTSSLIRNYPGHPHGISGDDLAIATFVQAWLFGANFVFAQAVTGLTARGDERRLRLVDGSQVAARPCC